MDNTVNISYIYIKMIYFCIRLKDAMVQFSALTGGYVCTLM